MGIYYQTMSSLCITTYFAYLTEVVFTMSCSTYSTRETCLMRSSEQGQKCAWSSRHQQCHNRSSFTDDMGGSSLNEDISTYDPHLAYNYTLMSALAYSENPQTCQSRIFPDSEFVLLQSIASHCEDLPLFKHEICYAYTAVSKKYKTILIAFRGTVTTPNATQLIDQIISVLLQPKKHFISGGKVQRYFKNAHDKLSPCVEKSVKNLTEKYPGYHLVITGHSLGAAIASLSAASLVSKGIVKGGNTSVFLYGEPRVGDGDYATCYDKLIKNSWRVVHSRDIVTHLPTCSIFSRCSVSDGGPYHTKTEVFYPNVDMKVTSAYKVCAHNEDMSCSDGLVQKHWCFDVANCVDDHKHYFGIAVGTICDGKKSKRNVWKSVNLPRGDRFKDQGNNDERHTTDSCSTTNF